MLYHYTHLIEPIRKSGVLLPENDYNRESIIFPGEKLALWFSTSKEVDPTSSAAHKKMPIWRIAVDDTLAPIQWDEYHARCITNGMPRKFLRALKETSYGSWRSWRCTFNSIYEKDWKEVILV
jgi:hypothetical protein